MDSLRSRKLLSRRSAVLRVRTWRGVAGSVALPRQRDRVARWVDAARSAVSSMGLMGVDSARSREIARDESVLMHALELITSVFFTLF
jgi:hypothetical protein